MKTPIRFFRYISIASCVTLLAGLSGSPALAGVVDPNKCGGLNQPTCELSAAKFLGKTKNSKPSGAFTDPRKGGEYWKCPSNRPRRTLNKVTGDKACATKKIVGEKLSSATFLGKVHKPKPSGAFVDIRKGGEYWRCPAGFFRNAKKVTDKHACTVDPGKNCDSGNIAVGGLSKGYTCAKRKVCGKKGQRPCQIVERIPSCNKGLAEDFVANLCIDKVLASCLTGVRMVRYGLIAKALMTKAEKEAYKLVKKMRDEIFSKLPGFSSANKATRDKALKKMDKAFGVGKKKQSNIDELLEVASMFDPLLPGVAKLSNTIKRNKGKLKNLISSDSFCSMTASEREGKLKRLMGGDITKKASLSPSIFDEILDALMASPAFAAPQYGDPMVYLVGFTAYGVEDHVGTGIELFYGWDGKGKRGIFLGLVGVASTINKGQQYNIGYGFAAASFDDLAGAGFTLGGGVDVPSKIPGGAAATSLGMDVGFSVDLTRKKPIKFETFMITYGSAANNAPGEISITAGHVFLIADLSK